jgi:hypothetical protein
MRMSFVCVFNFKGGSAWAQHVACSDEPEDLQEAFLEYSGMDFWELVAEQRDLKLVHDTLHSLKTIA